MSEETPGYVEEGEHPCERLIRIIQGREGAPSKQKREDACIELLAMFRGLINHVAWSLYQKFEHCLQQDYQTWHQDTVSTVIELVLSDYVPKKYGGKAMFAPYLKTKLWFRRLYQAQIAERNMRREQPADTTPTDIVRWTRSAGWRTHDFIKDSGINSEVIAAIYSHIVDQSESLFDRLSRRELWNRIDAIFMIAQKVLNDGEFYIWYHAIFSEKNMEQISQSNPYASPDKKEHTKQKTYNTLQRVRQKVLLAYAKEQLAGRV